MLAILDIKETKKEKNLWKGLKSCSGRHAMRLIKDKQKYIDYPHWEVQKFIFYSHPQSLGLS